MKNIGIFAGAFKPFTKGHYAVVQKASQENDKVVLIVSQGDRVRKGQFPIYWKDMSLIWKKYIESILPSNVDVLYVSNPITAVMELLEKANNEQVSNIKFNLYSDADDMKGRFDNQRTRKNFSFLFDNQLLNLIALPRLLGASGTKTRRFLELGLVDEFINELPEPIQSNGHEIFKQLGAEKV